jgi:hypothetical protein
MKAILVVSIVFSVHSILAMKCPTCRGASCKSDNVPMEECNFRHPFPLIASVKTFVFQDDSNYACLHLEHIKDGELEEISQCIVTNPGYDVCNQLIKENEGVTSCSVKNPQLLRETGETPSVPTAETPSVPTAETPSVPTAKTPSVPTAKTPSVPTAETPSVPTAETPSVPTAKTPSAPTAETPSVPTAETPSSPTGETPSAPTAETPTPAPDSKDGAAVNQISLAVLLLTLLYGWCL